MRSHGPPQVVPHQAKTSGPPKKGLLAVLLAAQLMVILDVSAVNVALPDMAADLGIRGTDIGWVVTSYSLIFGSLLLLGGRAADLLGRRRLFLAGLGIFTVASLASAVSTNAAMLFSARAGQGLGAAMLSPAALSVISSAFHGEQRAKALGAWGAVGGAGAAIGVLMGGVLTELSDWRTIFYVNLPVGVVLAMATTKVVAKDAVEPEWRGLDLRGTVVATLSLAAILYAASQAGSAGWTSSQTLAFGTAGLLGLTAFAGLEMRTEQPLLRVQRLADRAVGGGFLLMLVASAVLFGLFLLASIYLQSVHGTGPLETGLAFLPVAVVTGLGAHLGSRFVPRYGLRLPMAGGFTTTALGMLLLAAVDGESGFATNLLPGLLLAGLGLGIVLVGVAFSVLTGVQEGEDGMLAGLNNTGHEVGGAFGVAVLVSIAAAGGAGPGSLALGGIAEAFLAAALLAGAGAVVATTVLPPARNFLPKLRQTSAPTLVH